MNPEVYPAPSADHVGAGETMSGFTPSERVKFSLIALVAVTAIGLEGAELIAIYVIAALAF